VTGWDYAAHPGDCCPRVRGALWEVCCRECAGTGVFPVPWCPTVEQARADPDASCVACKGSGRAVVGFAACGRVGGMLTLEVHPAAGDDPHAVAAKAALLAPHVDEVRVRTAGVGWAVAGLLADAGVTVTRHNPAERQP